MQASGGLTTTVQPHSGAFVENSNLVLFYLKSDWESNTKNLEDFLSFLTGIHLPSSNQRFRRYDFLQDDGLLKTVFLDRLQRQKKNKI
jgi:hypothetical protein